MTGTEEAMITYVGVITIRDLDDADVLFLVNPDEPDQEEPLARRIEDDLKERGRYVDVAYWIADQPAPLGQLQESWLRHVLGDEVEAEYNAQYSDVTGHLWTDQYVIVGGHDLLGELTNNVGKYIHLQITYHRERRLSDHGDGVSSEGA